MNSDQLRKIWQEESQRPLQGWDFSVLDGRCDSTPLPWDYRAWIERFRTPESDLLDMGTGGGEFLLTLGHPPEKTKVTEGYPPNLALCRKKLEPLGITVREISDESHIPFDSEEFDLVINRHESFSSSEVMRVLRPGGIFVTQQVGGQNNQDLSRFLLPDYSPLHPDHHLTAAQKTLEAIGFTVITAQEAFPILRFYDVGALVFFAGIISWEFPGFSVDNCFDRLLLLDQKRQETGVITSTEHRFLLVARKPE